MKAKYYSARKCLGDDTIEILFKDMDQSIETGTQPFDSIHPSV